MLGDINAHATVPVRELEKARHFYEEVLGLTPVGESEQDVMYKTGDTHIVIYESPNAGTNKGTTLSWELNEPEPLIENLQRRGVKFEQYELPGVEREGVMHRMGPMVAAWFKDPDGNILCLGNAL